MIGFPAFIIFPLTGFFILGLLRPLRLTQNCGEVLPSIFGLGTLAAFLFFLLFSHLGSVPLPAFYFLSLTCGVAWAFKRVRSDPQSCRQHASTPVEKGIAVVLVTVALGVFFLGFGLPLLDWDTRILWALKSKVLAAEPDLAGGFFRDPYRLHIHPRYPLLVPFLGSWAARHQGAFVENQYQFLVGIFALFSLWQLYLVLNRLAGRRIALLLVLFMAFSGVWINAQFNSSVEVVLTFYALLATNALLSWQETRERTDLILAGLFFFGAAMTKNEGLLLAVAAMFAIGVVEGQRTGLRTAAKGAFLLFAIFAFLELVWLSHLVQIPPVSDEHYLQRLRLQAILEGAQRLPQIGAAIAARVSDFRQWHLLWLIPLCFPIAFWPGAKVDWRWRLIVLICIFYFCGILLVYIISPWRNISMHVGITFDRITLPLLPLLALAAAFCLKYTGREHDP